MERELAGWIEGIAAKAEAGEFKPAGVRRVVGAFDDDVLTFLEGRDVVPATAAISISDRDIMHALRTAKVEPLPVTSGNDCRRCWQSLRPFIGICANRG